MAARSALGQNRKYSLRADDVRSTHESGLKSDIRPCPKSATSRLMLCSNCTPHSISSSVRARNFARTARANAWAILRLRTGSNLLPFSAQQWGSPEAFTTIRLLLDWVAWALYFELLQLFPAGAYTNGEARTGGAQATNG